MKAHSKILRAGNDKLHALLQETCRFALNNGGLFYVEEVYEEGIWYTYYTVALENSFTKAYSEK